MMLSMASVSYAPTVDLDYDRLPGEAPSWDPDGALLTAHFESAVALWTDIIEDSHDIRIQYQWEELDDAGAVTIWHTSEKHYFDTDGDGHNDSAVERITNCTIKVDPNQSWWADPTPWDSSEFKDPVQVIYRDHVDVNPAEPAYAGSPPDLLEVSCDMEPKANSGRDMYSTILHEMGHAFGFNSSNIDVDPPYRLPSEMVWGADVRVHDERHEGDQNESHIDVPKALMSYNRVSQNRTLPSATDVLAMAQFCHWTRIDMPRKDFMHVDGYEAYWDHPLNWTGARVPDADDEVHIRSGDDVLVHWDAEAKSVTVGEGSSLTITGDQVLRLNELHIQQNGKLGLSWSGSRVEFLDPATGLPIAHPAVTLSGSFDMTNVARQTFGTLTMQDDDPGVGYLPRLTMDDDAVLTLKNGLNLIGGVEASLSNAEIVFTSPTRAELNLNGTMQLADGSAVTTRTLEMMADDGMAPRLSVLTGSSLYVTDDGAFVETIIPAAGTIGIDNAGSSATFANKLINRGTLTLEHGSLHAASMDVAAGARLDIKFGGELHVAGPRAVDGDLVLRRDSIVQLQHSGSLIVADEVHVLTPLDVEGGARIETEYIRVNAWSGDNSEITMTLNGVGTVLETNQLRLQSSPAHSARIVHAGGVAVVGTEMFIQSASAPGRYQLQTGRLTVADVLRVEDGARLEFDLDGGDFEVDRLDLETAGQFILNLNGGTFSLEALPAAVDGMTLNLNGGLLDLGGLGDLTLGHVKVATGSGGPAVDHAASVRQTSMRSLTVGHSGEGRITFTGPVTVEGPVVVGQQAGAEGKLVFSPFDQWAVLSAQSLQVGPAGRGTVTQTNGYVSVDDAHPLEIGRGEYRLQGGRLQTLIGHIGTTVGMDALMRVEGGRWDVDTLRIGRIGDWAGCRVVSGRLAAGEVVVADLQEGSLIQDNGTIDVGRDLLVGGVANQHGRVEMNDGRMNISGDLRIGTVDRARGVVTVHGGAINLHGSLIVGQGTDSIGQFEGADSVDIDGHIFVGAGAGSQADFRIAGSPGAYPTLDVAGGIRIAGGPDSRADFYILGQGSQGPTLWLVDQPIDVGSGGTGTLHLAGGRIRAVRNLAGEYDSYVKIQPASSLRGYGQIDIPVINTGLVCNDTNVPLQLMSKASGGGLYQTTSDPATFQSGRIEFWDGGEIPGGIVTDGRVSAFSSANSLSITGPIHGTGVFEAAGRVDTSGQIDVAHLRVTGDLRQRAGLVKPDLLELNFGSYTLQGGSLEVTAPILGGTLQQDGGSIYVADHLTIGPEGGFSVGFGTLRLNSGTLQVAGDLQIGYADEMGMGSYGTLEILQKDPLVTIEGDLIITEYGTIEAVEDVTINLVGSNVINTSTNPAALAGLQEMTLQFAADGSVVDHFEVAGDPDGGFEGNFALGGLSVGLGTQLQLVDEFDNLSLPAEQDEALLVDFLTFSGDATIDLNGLDLLVRQQGPDAIESWIAQGRIVNGGAERITVFYDAGRSCTVLEAAPVPEPTCMVLMAVVWGGYLIGRKRS